MIRAGVVGMGFIGQVHAKGYQATEGVTLAAVCDTDETKLKPKNEAAGDDRLGDIKTAIEVLAEDKK